jgi:hypothetical protein
VTSLEYGDYTYFVDSIWNPPEKIVIEKNTLEKIILSFTYNHKNYRVKPGTTWPYQGSLVLTKIMSLKKGYPGVFVKLQSIPVNPPGEREIGFGSDSPLVFSERVVSQHPLARHHVDLEMDKARYYYAVSLPLSDSFYRILVLPRPMKTFSYQFDPDVGGGKVTVNQLIEHESDKYQVFLGAVPFDSRQSLVEFESFQNIKTSLRNDKRASGGRFLIMREDKVQQCLIPLKIASAGQYRIALRYRGIEDSTKLSVQIDAREQLFFDVLKSKEFDYLIIDDHYQFSSGEHNLIVSLESGEIGLDSLVILPISNKQDFPLDIVTKVLPEMILMQSRFEGESLFSATGRNVPDEASSNGAVRFADVHNDKPEFLVFGPYQRVVLPGNYVGRFHLKVQDNTIVDQVAILEVFSNIAGTLALKILTGKDFIETNKYQAFELDFTIQPTYPSEVHRLEFRVYFPGNANLWVDYIELIGES